MRPPIVLVKLGGSLITEKSREETARPEADQHEEELERIMLDLDGLLASEADEAQPATSELTFEGAR